MVAPEGETIVGIAVGFGYQGGFSWANERYVCCCSLVAMEPWLLVLMLTLLQSYSTMSWIAALTMPL